VRSSHEIRFRFKQELVNLWRLPFPPVPHFDSVAITPGILPDGSAVAARLRGTAYAASTIERAQSILAGDLSLLGYCVRVPFPTPWRHDLVHGRETGLDWFRRIPYLRFDAAGDHKVVWELNRHQHLAALAQAWLFDPQPAYIDRIAGDLDSWLDQNPYGRGINWTSALEVAIRAMSWLWILHWTQDALPRPLYARLLSSLHAHGLYIETNLSTYFSPNTHLLGEAVALYMLGLLTLGGSRWRELADRIVEQQMESQIRPDGSHFEQSAYYHVYTIDFFLLYAVLARPTLPPSFSERLRKSAEYLHALLGPGGSIPFLGDDDGGRVFSPFGARDRFGRATLAACAAYFGRADWPAEPDALAEMAEWWIGPVSAHAGGPHRSNVLFPDAGVAMLSAGDWQAVIDTRAFGFAGAGHSHASALSVVLRRGETEALIDPGTFTYVSDPRERDRFRSTTVHNTVTIDGLDQARAAGPFRWTDKPSSQVLEWDPARGRIRAEVHYRGFRHERELTLDARTLRVIDRVEGPPGDHTVTQTWHEPHNGSPAQLRGSFDTAPGLRSLCFGSSEPSVLRTRTVRGPLPVEIEAVFDLNPPG
jgi:hypothetical protein